MSDLLPLLVAVSVRDKVLTDAKEELEKLHKRDDVATSIEVVHDAVDGHGKILVYASGKFEEGTYDEIFEKREYDGEIFWKVSFNHPRVYKLFDLNYCHICVGGGFSIFEFSSEDYREAWLDGTNNEGDLELRVRSLQPFNLWVTFCIRGVPENRWQHSVGKEFYLEPMVEEMMTDYPEATVEFQSVRFEASTIRGPLQRLLPPRQKK